MKNFRKSKKLDYRKIKHICKRCNTKHSISRDDLVAEAYYIVDDKTTESCFYDLIWEHEEKIGFGFHCPNCNHFNWIEQEDSIPTYVRKALASEYQIKPKSNSSYFLKASAVCSLIIIGLITYLVS